MKTKITDFLRADSFYLLKNEMNTHKSIIPFNFVRFGFLNNGFLIHIEIMKR